MANTIEGLAMLGFDVKKSEAVPGQVYMSDTTAAEIAKVLIKAQTFDNNFGKNELRSVLEDINFLEEGLLFNKELRVFCSKLRGFVYQLAEILEDAE